MGGDCPPARPAIDAQARLGASAKDCKSHVDQPSAKRRAQPICTSPAIWPFLTYHRHPNAWGTWHYLIALQLHNCPGAASVFTDTTSNRRGIYSRWSARCGKYTCGLNTHSYIDVVYKIYFNPCGLAAARACMCEYSRHNGRQRAHRDSFLSEGLVAGPHAGSLCLRARGQAGATGRRVWFQRWWRHVGGWKEGGCGGRVGR